VEAIIDYEESVAMIQEALNLTVLANQTVNVTLANINNLMTEGLVATATILINISMEILGEAERLYDITRGLLQRVNEARQAYERAQNQTQQISDNVIMLNHDVNELTRAVSMNHDRLNDILNTIQRRLDTVYMIYEYVKSVVPVLEQNVTSSQSQLGRIKMVIHINSK
jgi:cell division protein ZapA (FtsZ GTPase activity inhibitor)